MKQEMMGWQWRQLDHIQIVYTSLHTEKGRMLFLTPSQQRQSTKGIIADCRNNF